MDFLLEAITTWLKEMLVGGIMSNLSGMFDSVNQQVADISVQVGQTPQGWNGSIFGMIQNLSNSIIVPIAGVILAAVMTIELIQMITDKNNLHDVDTWMIFKWMFKSAAAILIVTNTWRIYPSGRSSYGRGLGKSLPSSPNFRNRGINPICGGRNGVLFAAPSSAFSFCPYSCLLPALAG